MSSAVQFGSVQLIPVKEAAEFVPYSRDYVARLAREGKVTAVQIDRQWFVEVVSLQNFFSHATIEESVRKRHLSTKRKRDLEVKEVYENQLQLISDKRQKVQRIAMIQTAVILFCGFASGLLFTAANESNVPDNLQAVGQLFFPLSTIQTAAVSASTLGTTTLLEAVNSHVEVNDDALDVQRGIVVLPGAAAGTSVVEDFFSDPVTVEMTSTTTGKIRNKVSNESIPFVKVPIKIEVVPAEESNKSTP